MARDRNEPLKGAKLAAKARAIFADLKPKTEEQKDRESRKAVETSARKRYPAPEPTPSPAPKKKAAKVAAPKKAAPPARTEGLWDKFDAPKKPAPVMAEPTGKPMVALNEPGPVVAAPKPKAAKAKADYGITITDPRQQRRPNLDVHTTKPKPRKTFGITKKGK
jgi:hypothetical protein